MKVSDWAAVATAVATGLLLVVTAVAVTIAVYQLIHARRQMRAQFLFELESRWRSDKLEKGHKEFADFVKKVGADIKTINATSKYPRLINLPDEKKKERLYSVYLFLMKQHDRDRYRVINSMLEYLEAVGVIVYKVRGLDIETVASLLAGPITSIDRITRRHIEQMRKSQKEEGLFEYTIMLFDGTKKWLQRIRAGSIL